MMIGAMQLSQLQALTQGQLVGPDVSFNAVCTDSRTLKPGDLFVALTGARFDAHAFVAQAGAAGAVAAVVSRPCDTDLPQLVVEDTEQALGWLGHLNRQKSAAVVVAITGSQGKTSVKEMTGAILQQRFMTLVTAGNLNNTVGAPLTLLKLNTEHNRAVIELGANGAGEIAWTARMTNPHIVLINNAAETHLEGFGSLAGVVQAKGEIIDSGADTHTVILNADDNNVGQWQARAVPRKVRLFSVQRPEADYRAEHIRVTPLGTEFNLVTPAFTAECHLSLPGRHNVANAVAAAALACEAGATADDIVNGLAQMKPVPGRLCPLAGINSSRVIDDSYNASPSSFRAAIDVLAEIGKQHTLETVLIMGDMAELGEEAPQLHAGVGEYARASGINQLLACGPLSHAAVQAFGSGAQHFVDRSELQSYLQKHTKNNQVLLVKGSRSAGMDKVVSAISAGGEN